VKSNRCCEVMQLILCDCIACRHQRRCRNAENTATEISDIGRLTFVQLRWFSSAERTSNTEALSAEPRQAKTQLHPRPPVDTAGPI